MKSQTLHSLSVFVIIQLQSPCKGNPGLTEMEIDIPLRRAKTRTPPVFQVLIQPSSPGYYVFSSALCVAFIAN